MVTKRKILSEIAKLFDPLGLLGPVILHAKRLMQDVWRCETHWDESVPQSLHTEWSEFVQQLDSIRQISFDRGLIAPEFRDIQLHGFCDASEVGYGACIYIRSVGKHRNIICKLACAKSRIAPLKTVTIPRLELCGALILARLYRETSNALKITPDKVVFWSDSTIVLQWLKTSPHLLKTYVANRVVEIQDLTGSYEWRHVKSGDNPADAISRSQLPHNFLRNDTWQSGPRWLVRNESEWPIENMQLTELTELRRNACLTIHLDSEILKRYSSYSKLCRVVAYCLRFRLSNKNTGPLDATEINESEIRILRILQSTQFSNEIKLTDFHASNT
ncbi:PREDICTED: uncharacterized protein LOC105555962 [Vollenhovia emeryi]|uniref:uncharacterized protein LOC105555962 n=1 Tax=Vollenhovia emeryi TaxID=411798 RepID=UPI0005F476AF|nr:PREDICTED: uncharacterized protein LOC105555962 [Vollenhovia emeryi]